jgi:hypothetical protein
MTELETLKRTIAEAQPKLAEAVATIRTVARTVNELGAIASTLQRDAQDAEAGDDLPAEIRAFLDGSLLQRTGSVNTQSAEFAEKSRRLIDAIRNLESDGQKVVALIDKAAEA